MLLKWHAGECKKAVKQWNDKTVIGETVTMPLTPLDLDPGDHHAPTTPEATHLELAAWQQCQMQCGLDSEDQLELSLSAETWKLHSRAPGCLTSAEWDHKVDNNKMCSTGWGLHNAWRKRPSKPAEVLEWPFWIHTPRWCHIQFGAKTLGA